MGVSACSACLAQGSVAPPAAPSTTPTLPPSALLQATAAPEAPSSTPKTSSGLHDVVIVGAVRGQGQAG